MAFSRREFLKASGGTFAGILTGCATRVGIMEKPLPLAKVPGGPADLILYNGNILTVDVNDRVVQAVAISKGVIQKLGTNLEVSSFKGLTTQAMDLKGRTVTPGIIDAHNHMMYFGEQIKYRLDIRPPRVRTKEDLIRVVKEGTKTKPEGEWIYGCQGFLLMIKDSPTRWELDEVSPKHPVYL
ncbi:MAG: amidohydrolase family protein, partial [Deltaproteobacteria bacterium]|nr:amidohydrolase family protein [Deltaproteobacteria bacterium]